MLEEEEKTLLGYMMGFLKIDICICEYTIIKCYGK